jgi:hypothetical protein
MDTKMTRALPVRAFVTLVIGVIVVMLICAVVYLMYMEHELPRQTTEVTIVSKTTATTGDLLKPTTTTYILGVMVEGKVHALTVPLRKFLEVKEGDSILVKYARKETVPVFDLQLAEH